MTPDEAADIMVREQMKALATTARNLDLSRIEAAGVQVDIDALNGAWLIWVGALLTIAEHLTGQTAIAIVEQTLLEGDVASDGP